MPVDSHHPEYDRYYPQWHRCRVACDGTDAIKGARQAFLPKPSGMDWHDYDASYLMRAKWYGACGRVRQGWTGLVFREPPALTVPTRLVEHAKDITRTGVNLDAFAEHTMTDHATTGRVGILLDLPEDAQRADAVQPQWTLYCAEQIINWWTLRTTTGETVYSQVILEEALDLPDPHDPYQHKILPQWRELLLLDGVYVVRVWQKASASSPAFALVSERVPLRRGVPLPFIPFKVQNADTLDFEVGSPPILDIVDVNISHYQTTADYLHELHMCSLATPWVTGWDAEKEELRIGSMIAWLISNPQAHVGFLEVSGNGLQAKLDKIRADEQQMAVLGARLLEPQQRAVESAETHAIRQSAELSIMQAYAQATSTLLTTILRWHAWWAGLTEQLKDETISLTLNTDFLSTAMDGPTLTAVVGAWEKGALTQEDLFYNLQHGERLEPGVVYDEWRRRLAQEETLSLRRQTQRLLQQPGGLPPQAVPPEVAA